MTVPFTRDKEHLLFVKKLLALETVHEAAMYLKSTYFSYQNPNEWEHAGAREAFQILYRAVNDLRKELK